MTGTRDPQQDGSIQAMLSDSGLETAAELRAALEQLRAVVPDQAPAPRADLAALLAGAGDTGPDTAVVSLEDRRRGRKRRLAIVGGAVIGAMSLGAGAVAASSEDFRHSVSRTVGVIFQPAGHPAPATEHVQPSPSDVPAVPATPAPVATPAGTGTQGTSPAGTATSGADSRGASSGRKTLPTTPTAPPAVAGARSASRPGPVYRGSPESFRVAGTLRRPGTFPANSVS